MQKSPGESEVSLKACRTIGKRLMQVEITFLSISVNEEKARGDDSY
jgi:hypothetical protein